MIGQDPGAYAHDEDGKRVPATSFDYDQVEKDVFGFQADIDLAKFTPEEINRGLQVFRELVRWLWQNGMNNPEGLKIRGIIVCWIMLEELRGLTLTDMARGFGMDKQSLGRWVDQWKLDFPAIRTPHMRKSDETIV